MTTEKLKKAREAVRTAYTKINHPMDTVVDFWGKKMTLDEAINMMDSDDLRGARAQIKYLKEEAA
jgi:hypothetical protein